MPFQFACGWCARPFFAKRSRVAKGLPPRFCGTSCSAKWRNHNPELRQKRQISPVARARWSQNLKDVRKRPEVQEILRTHLSGENNPFSNPDVRRRSLLTRANKSCHSLNGGNGRPLPVPVRLLSQFLKWPTEVLVPVNPWTKADGNPKCFRIDIAEPRLRIAVEVDGRSHNDKLIQQKDRRKEVYLAAHGWTVLRFRNSKVLTEFDNVTATIMQAVKSLISRPAPATTLPTAS
jgi:hypothetical protein